MNTAANKASSTVLNWTERGLVPDSVIRAGIRRLCSKRLKNIGAQDIEASAVRLGLEDIGLHYATTLNHWRKNFFTGSVRFVHKAFLILSSACGNTICATAKRRFSKERSQMYRFSSPSRKIA